MMNEYQMNRLSRILTRQEIAKLLESVKSHLREKYGYHIYGFYFSKGRMPESPGLIHRDFVIR